MFLAQYLKQDKLKLRQVGLQSLQNAFVCRDMITFRFSGVNFKRWCFE